MILPLDATPGAVPREIYILAGQSNMVGNGELEERPAFANASRIKNFSNAWQWIDGAEPIDDPTNQVDIVSLDTGLTCVGPGMAFANKLASLRAKREIALVPCAKGGSGLKAHWGRNLSRSTLYGSMIARAKEAAKAGALCGLFWYQGEYETDSASNAASYAADWLAWFANVRTDLELPNLPAVVTILGPDPGRPYWSTVQAQIASLDGALGGKVAAITAADLTAPDGIHLNTASLVTVGERAGTAMHGLLSGA